MLKIVTIPIMLVSLFTPIYGIIMQLNAVVTWGELGISKQVSIIAGLTLMLIILIIAVIVMTNVWIRRGYEGLDSILEGKEVALLMSHIFGFVSLEIFIFMITFRNELNPPSYAFWICSGTFIAPEIYLTVHAIMKKSVKD